MHQYGQILQCAVHKIVHTSPRMFFWFAPSHSPGISSLASSFLLKILAVETPLPLRISSDHPWGGYRYFLEVHNVVHELTTLTPVRPVIGKPRHTTAHTDSINATY